MKPRLFYCLALPLALSAPAAAFTDPASGDIAPYTAESGAPMDEIKQAMETPHLGLSLRVDPDSKSISGLALYTVQAITPLDSVEFDLDPRFAISRISVNGTVRPDSSWKNDGGKLIIALPAPIAADETVQVEIAYSGEPRVAPNAPWDGGFVWARTPQGKDWIATAVQGTGCDLFWPCLDHPSKRVGVLDLVVTVPSGLTAASNGKLVSVEEKGGWSSYHWRAKAPNDYGVSLQIGPYELAEAEYTSRYGNSFPIQFWHLPGQEENAESLIAEMHTYLDFFESTIGPYPFSDEKVGVAETPHKGMEHQTINAYGNEFVASPEGYDELMQHEFAHEWFANQLTGARVSDLWLHEGFGTYMQPLFLEWKDGHLAYDAAMWGLRKRIHSRVPVAPHEEVSSTLYDDADAKWGQDIYYKGAWIAHTLRGLIGDDAFFASLRRMVYGRPDPAPGNFAPRRGTTAEFRQIAEEESGRDLGWFFDAYLRQAELPRLIAEQDGRMLRLKWESGSDQTFAMPVDVQVSDRLVHVPMVDGTGSVDLILPDAHYVLDPFGMILRDNPAIAAWQKQQQDKAKAGD
ncbi:aminopeptidase N [Altererythrobacter atlanticus]|uniref:Aminopeptidase N n=1 Tax=Croceibacterium atlanticum TaxID=1267766 RepID=A0A0F7KX31_9SPHN|nr:M1 family metallopeptidase [Croceibacterium atlanticum]AKH43360.1 Aminopeptidase N [Croceibacterium atlanticum]MBB5731933.1 aminopeptidase N [Croceibacterium atlanticum]